MGGSACEGNKLRALAGQYWRLADFVAHALSVPGPEGTPDSSGRMATTP